MFVLLSIFLDDPNDRDIDYGDVVFPAALFWPVILPILIIMLICMGGGRLSHKIHDAFYKKYQK